MDTGLAGKAALVTGGGTGIGLAIASALADEGVDVAVVSRTNRPEALELLREKGVRASWFGTDVSSETDIVSSVASIVAGFGRIDLIVSNAAHTHHEPITRITADNWGDHPGHESVGVRVSVSRGTAPHDSCRSG